MMDASRVKGFNDGIRLPEPAEIAGDDLGLVSVTASRTLGFSNSQGLHMRPAQTIHSLSERLLGDYGVIAWINTQAGGRAATTDILAMTELHAADKDLLTLDVRGPKAYGPEKLEGVIDVFASLFRDSTRQEGIDADFFIARAAKVFGKGTH